MRTTVHKKLTYIIASVVLFTAAHGLFAPNFVQASIGPIGANHSTKSGPSSAPAVAGTCETAGPIEVESSGGTTGPTAYPTLFQAFVNINAGTHTGTITIDVCGDTTETSSVLINASGSGSASYTSITISPAGGVARTIQGAVTAGSPLIDLNGADNVTINGLNTGGNSLTLSNTTASPTSGTSTIRFIGGATNNTITNASILGSFSATVGTNGGNIFFSTDAVALTGNDNNTISNNNIGPAGTNLPTKGVFLNGSTTTTANNNSGVIVTNNNIYDYFGAAVASAGIYVTAGNTDCNFTNNKFYQTAARTQTTASQHSAVWITNTSGNNFQVTGNTIGYASSAGTGIYTFNGIASSVFIPIFLSAGTTTASVASSNTITAISYTGASSGTSSSSPFRAIYVASGLATANSNTIGSTTATGAITYSSTSISTSEIIGIFNFGSNNFTANSNNIGGFNVGNTSATGSTSFTGIRVNTSSTVTLTANNNTIGGSVANSVNATSTGGTTAQVVGINNLNPAATMTGNTINNLTNSSANVGTGTSASVIGILNSASSANHTVSQNTISNLNNSSTTAAVIVTGINFNSSTGTNLVARNLIHSLSTASTSATATINGISITGGTATYQNNMIRLGVTITNGIIINGINETVSGIDNIYFNSIYIGGTNTGATAANTYAFQSTITTNTRNYIDNIFVNARSNSGAGTGKHYAIRVGGTTVNPTGLTSNYNVFYAPGTGGVFGLYNATDQATIAAWRTATGQDNNSIYGDPQFANPTGATPDLHINPSVATPIEGNGLAIVAVTDDFDGQARSGLTPTDIGADAGNFTSAGDVSPPTITYTTLGNTFSTANRTLSGVTITDPSGVNVAPGTRPRIYYKRSTDTNTFVDNTCSTNGWKYTEYGAPLCQDRFWGKLR